MPVGNARCFRKSTVFFSAQKCLKSCIAVAYGTVPHVYDTCMWDHRFFYLDWFSRSDGATKENQLSHIVLFRLLDTFQQNDWSNFKHLQKQQLVGRVPTVYSELEYCMYNNIRPRREACGVQRVVLCNLIDVVWSKVRIARSQSAAVLLKKASFVSAYVPKTYLATSKNGGHASEGIICHSRKANSAPVLFLDGIMIQSSLKYAETDILSPFTWIH